MTTLRTFIAIELDQELKTDLQRVQEGLQTQVAPRSVRWVRPDRIHLTLKFLADTPSEKVGEVKKALALAAAEVAPFTFGVGGLGCFPNTRRPRAVWVGLQDPTGCLVLLREAVESHVAPLGFPTETRPFRPHLTLGRVHRQASKSEVIEIGAVVFNSTLGSIGEMTATQVSFIESDLQPSGAVYTTLFAVGLAGG
jgi:2'-5' RNA ligase